MISDICDIDVKFTIIIPDRGPGYPDIYLALQSSALGFKESYCDVVLSSSLSLLRFITGSYDRRCRVWDTTSGQQLLSLEGHTNIVAAVAFNIPYGCELFHLIFS